MGDYRKLVVWQRSTALTDQIREVVSRLPANERRRLGDQACRAADSIPLNIAEGCGLNADSQLARHLSYAIGSANELQEIVDAVARRGQLDSAYQTLPAELTRLRSMLAVFHKRVSKAEGSKPARPPQQSNPSKKRKPRKRA